MNIKNATAQAMIDSVKAEYGTLDLMPERAGALQCYVTLLVEERDRLQGVIFAYEVRDEKRQEDAQDYLAECNEVRGGE